MTPTEISAVLYRITTDNSKSLERGLKDRERIAKSIGRGEDPVGHRVDFLRDAAHKVNELLLECAKEFNARYPADRISVPDLGDVLVTLLASYQKNGVN